MIRSIIPLAVAVRILIAIFSLVLVFHALVLAGVVPASIVWGGRVSGARQLILFELIAMFINTLMLVIIFGFAGIIPIRLSDGIYRGAFWAMTVLFCLNTLGNLTAITLMETLIFTPITALLALLSWRLAVGKP